jgi:hypothetical protein
MVKKITTEDNFNYLLFALVFLLFSIAAVEQFAGGAGQHLVIAATVVTLVTAVWSIREQARWFRTGLGFTGFLIAIVVIGTFFNWTGLDTVQLLLMLGFFVMTTMIAARQVLFTGEITGNKIVGTICIFLLLGLIWALLYLLLLELDPATFNNMEYGSWQDNFSKIVYFSFVTMTTLGYGEITPALPLARFLAYLEAIMGLFYIAIMVASLVGVRIASLSVSPPRDE